MHTMASLAVDIDPDIAQLSTDELAAAIAELRSERNAVILAHNYQLPEVQDVADFVGDSLQLSQEAAATSADVIAFCGVHFMAETAAILCPDKQVLVPDPDAGCSLADSITVDQVLAWKAEHPGAVAVGYVNTSAAVKAELDYCCTSRNARQVIEAVPADREILFLPDQHLGAYVQAVTGRRLLLWPGECHVHAAFDVDQVRELSASNPDADVLLHPECGCVLDVMRWLGSDHSGAARTHVLSTGGMVEHARACRKATDLVATETGMLHRLRQENARTTFVPVRDDAVCSYMKTITLPKLFRALRDDVYEVRVPEPVASRARRAIDRMLACI